MHRPARRRVAEAAFDGRHPASAALQTINHHKTVRDIYVQCGPVAA